MCEGGWAREEELEGAGNKAWVILCADQRVCFARACDGG